ncbi:MAG: hypothetical protein HFJ51_04805, partial [Clostridia bacterium]|nr:hypothetical protein [Clostridia bacterium]
GYNNWHWYETVWDAGANAWRADITGATYGQYNTWFYTHIYPYDHAGNTACYPKDDQKVYIPNPNTAPVIQSAEFSSKTTNSLTFTARATDAENDNLTYTLYTSTDGNNWTLKQTLSNQISGTQATLTASGLTKYTDYYWKIDVSDGKLSNSTGRKAQARTKCDGSGYRCSGGTFVPCSICGGSGSVTCGGSLRTTGSRRPRSWLLWRWLLLVGESFMWVVRLVRVIIFMFGLRCRRQRIL